MTTPVDPVSTEPTGSVPLPDPGNSQQPGGSPTDQDLRDLVATLQKDKADGPCCHQLKATVSAVNNTASPPTIDIQFPAATNSDGSPGTPVSMSNVRYIDSYSPVVGDTAVLMKQGSDLTAYGQINDTGSGAANGWQTVSPGSGFSHNGNSEGTLMIRVVVDNGDLKVQFKGALAISGTPTAIGTMPSGSWPTGGPRTLLVARDPGGGSNVAQVSVSTSGVMTLVGGTTAPPSATSSSTTPGVTGSPSTNTTGGTGDLNTGGPSDNVTNGSGALNTGSPSATSTGGPSTNSTSSVDPIDTTTTDSGHSHGVTGSHAHDLQNHTHAHDHFHTTGDHTHGMKAHFHTTGTHTHDMANHTHTSAAHTHTVQVAVTAPVWISFTDKSYFI